jgi:ABC-type transport system involved in cytochrome c biogenesis permease subunit
VFKLISDIFKTGLKGVFFLIAFTAVLAGIFVLTGAIIALVWSTVKVTQHPQWLPELTQG